LSFVSNYSGFFSESDFLLLRNGLIKVIGKVSIMPNGIQIAVTYRPSFNPFYIFIPTLLLLCYCLFSAETIIINGEAASLLNASKLTNLTYIFIVTFITVIILSRLNKEKEILERELKVMKIH